MSGPARGKMPALIDGDQYFKTSKGLVVNISEIVRMTIAVNAAIPPGASEAEEDRIIHETVKRMSAN